MDMVTRVSHALAKAELDDGDVTFDVYALTEEIYDRYLAQARAVIKAMREPTPEQQAEYAAAYDRVIWMKAQYERAMREANGQKSPTGPIIDAEFREVAALPNPLDDPNEQEG